MSPAKSSFQLNSLNEPSLTQSFTTLVKSGKIIFDPDQRLIPYTAGPLKFPLLFYVTAAFTSKPQFGTSTPEDQGPDDFLPGSDISIKGFEICNVGEGDSHVLAWNKFAMFDTHMILLTLDGYKRQSAPLETGDLRALWSVLGYVTQGGEHDWIGIYNCGKDGGCSRLHKHMQLFPLRRQDGFQMFPDTDVVKGGVPFRYHLHRFIESVVEPGDVFEAYAGLLEKAKGDVGIDSADVAAEFPHNVVLSRRWIVVIPRKMNRFEGLGVNAAGMMGLVGVSSEEYEGWLEVGPEKVLTKSGVEV